TGAMAAGLFVLALSPGGTTSNVLSFLAKGDIALSITLTAVVSLVTPFIIPFMLAPALDHFMSASEAVSLPIVKTIITLLAITAIPVAIGMLIRRKAPAFSLRMEPVMRWASLAVLMLVIGAILAQQWADLPRFFAEAGLPALVLNVAALALGFFTSRGLRLGHEQSVTIGVE